jgi:tetratricopeptide (TPR) repeat protein
MGKNLPNALELAEAALKLAPEELRGFGLDVQGWVLYKHGDYARSLEILQQSARLDACAQTLIHLGMAALALGLKEESKDAFRTARKRQSRPEELPFRLWHALKLELRSKLA